WSIAVTQAFERSYQHRELIHSPRLKALAQRYLGPDVIWFNYDALFVNVPDDSDPVTTKAFHTDVWTGTGVNTLFAITFFTDVDEKNGLTVVPGSHLQGLWPVRNRKIELPGNLRLEESPQPTIFDHCFMPPKNLDMICAGDIIIWHPLLIHATT